MDFDTLAQWAQQLKEHKTVAWSQLPDIDLYMDQVITYLERQTALLRAQDQDKMMTPSMINNYAKNGILPRPQGKKYSREHLALLMAISMIKPIISMEEIERLLRFYRTKENVDGMFSARRRTRCCWNRRTGLNARFRPAQRRRTAKRSSTWLCSWCWRPMPGAL